VFIVASNGFSFLLRFDGDVPPRAIESFWHMLPWLLAIRTLTFIPFRLFEGLWRYTSLYDLRALVGGVAVSSALFWLLVKTPLGSAFYPRSIFVMDAALLLLALSGIRLSRRFANEFGRIQPGRRVLIIGAGGAGEKIVRDMKNNPLLSYRPIGFVDDDPSKVGLRIHGVPVLGTRRDLSRLLEQCRPEETLIALPNAAPDLVRSIVRSLEPYKIPIKTIPNLRDILDGRVEVAQIRNLAVDDLLTRAPVGLDTRPVRRLIAGRRVMVTGAGGSIGSELCRQIARLQPAALIMFERYENSLHAIRLELEDEKRWIGLHAIVGDITDDVRVNDVMAQYRPEIVFHAAAHKHVPLMEENPCEAIKNNVRGTRILAGAADRHGVDRFILISTDKAVNPTSMMGSSKRLAELAVQAQAVGSGTSFSIVRFGNVLGSNGSVVPRFLEQIKKGGPVTVTHPEIRRFFMLIPEAVQLVLHAASQAESGATYVLEMGDQVKVVDIARDLIRLAGFVPDEDIKIAFVGLRPGEKLYEELAGSDEDATPSKVEKVLCVRSRHRVDASLFARLDEIEAEAFEGQSDAVRVGVKALVGSTETPGPPPVPEIATQAVPSGAAADEGEMVCARCSKGRLHRSRAKTLFERARKEFSVKRPYRCDSCGWRGWLPVIEHAVPLAVDEVAAPELSLLDRAVATVPEGRRPFSPRDLV
jgi:FlaA1/EpsC-like NDP-sugar epimerase